MNNETTSVFDMAKAMPSLVNTDSLHTAAPFKNLFPIQKLEALVFLLLFAGSLVFYFKDRFNPLIGSIIYCIAKIALDFLRQAHLYHVITATQVMCVVIIVIFMLLNRQQLRVKK